MKLSYYLGRSARLTIAATEFARRVAKLATLQPPAGHRAAHQAFSRRADMSIPSSETADLVANVILCYQISLRGSLDKDAV